MTELVVMHELVCDGEGNILADAPLSSLPLVVSGGSIIPTVSPAGAVSRLSYGTVTINVFPRSGASDEARTTVADTPTGLKFVFLTTEHVRLRIHRESIADADAKGATVQSTRTIEGVAEIELDITERGEITLKRIDNPAAGPAYTASGNPGNA